MSGKRRVKLLGEIYQNQYGFKFEIVGYCKNRFKRIIKFIDTGYTMEVYIQYIKDGCSLCDPYNTPTVFGVGISDLENGSEHILYNRWIHMLGRCYSEKHPQYKSYGDKGVKVEEYFLRFSNYVDFISNLENYDLLLQNPDEYQIDKDIKIGRKNIYSRETVSIVKRVDNLKEENDNKKISVRQYTLNGEFVAKFDSIVEAERITGIHKGNIARCIKNKIKTAGGYIWGN